MEGGEGGDIVLVTAHGLLIRRLLFSLETYNLYSIASQLKRFIDPVTNGISREGVTNITRPYFNTGEHITSA